LTEIYQLFVSLAENRNSKASFHFTVASAKY